MSSSLTRGTGCSADKSRHNRLTLKRSKTSKHNNNTHTCSRLNYRLGQEDLDLRVLYRDLQAQAANGKMEESQELEKFIEMACKSKKGQIPADVRSRFRIIKENS